MATSGERYKATQLIVDACQLVERFNHDLPTVDLQPSIYGNLSAFKPDRACRLLLFHKIAHALSGDAHWDDLYREKLEEQDRRRLRCTTGPDPIPPNRNLHAAVQSQASWSALHQLEQDPEIRAVYAKALRDGAVSVMYRIDGWTNWEPGTHDPDPNWRELWQTWRAENPDVDFATPDGRRPFLRFRTEHSSTFVNDRVNLRNPIDAFAVCMWCEDTGIRRDAVAKALPLLQNVDFNRVQFGTALACLEGAYWRAVAAGLFADT